MPFLFSLNFRILKLHSTLLFPNFLVLCHSFPTFVCPTSTAPLSNIPSLKSHTLSLQLFFLSSLLPHFLFMFILIEKLIPLLNVTKHKKTISANTNEYSYLYSQYTFFSSKSSLFLTKTSRFKLLIFMKNEVCILLQSLLQWHHVL